MACQSPLSINHIHYCHITHIHCYLASIHIIHDIWWWWWHCDTRPNPWFISHMPTVFNKKYVTEHHLHEQKRAENEERLKNKKRAKEMVVCYAWCQVWSIDFWYPSCWLNIHPRMVRMSLSCFRVAWLPKHFTLTGDIFVHLELCFMNTADLISSVKHWKKLHRGLVKVLQGHCAWLNP